MIDSIPRVSLADLPTPLHDAPRLARHLGMSRLLLKRDDMTGLAMGGNKARKLEYDFADIIRKNCDVVVTVGGAQSNHARMTAAAARRLGLDVKLVLGGPELARIQGNVLLDVLFGAEIRYLRDDDDNDHLAAAMMAWVAELTQEGRRPYALPIGGSSGLGALGYVRAMRELATQFGAGPVQIILPVGSCGTLAGVLLGTALYLPQARIVGISVSRTAAQIRMQTIALMGESRSLLQVANPLPDVPIEIYDTYHQEYGAFTESAREAIVETARLEGVLLDPIYTGKSMAGLFDLVRRGVLDTQTPTIFLHTGGLPILFAYGEHFSDLSPLAGR
jgi:D-cysteine desulfhydrase family pyridoxal phosphate-dependent enzyme